MPSTVTANNLSTVHASSNGITQWFPDACKTPTPGGPVPIPYPNIAMSSDTADGSTTVKVQGNPIMLKGSSFRMSTGDEAGSAMGVVSNKIKGKAEPVMYSFDVKVDGKNVFRLADPMTHNGNMANGGGTPVGQPNLPAFPSNGPECDRTKAEKEKQQNVAESGWANSGVVAPHRPIIKTVAGEEGVVLYIRKTKPECTTWILAGHHPKPHSCMDGTTIATGAQVAMVQRWLDRHFAGLTDAERRALTGLPASPRATADRYSRVAAEYIGIIGIPVGDGMIRPEKGKGRYKGKWMTGDYDLFELLANGPGCKKITKDGGFAKVKKKINKRCGLTVIQHPPQAQWVPDAHDIAKGVTPFDMNAQVRDALAQGGSALLRKMQWHPQRKKMPIIDSPLTVVAGDGAVTLEKKKQVRDALVCQQCDQA
jgi:hypothetical protein